MFGQPKIRKPNREELALLSRLAHIAEGVGEDRLRYGVDDSLLPAPRTEMLEIVARCEVWKKSLGGGLLPGDLRNMYAIIGLFLPIGHVAEILNALTDEEGARDIGADGAFREEVQREYEAACEHVNNAANLLAAHADRLREGER